MDNENKKILSKKQMTQVSGGDDSRPNSYGEKVCPVCGSTDVQYIYTDVADNYCCGKLLTNVWICNSCGKEFIFSTQNV